MYFNMELLRVFFTRSSLFVYVYLHTQPVGRGEGSKECLVFISNQPNSKPFKNYHQTNAHIIKGALTKPFIPYGK